MEEGRYTHRPGQLPSSTPGPPVRADLVSCRENGDFILARPETIDFIDVSPKQLVSVAAALIPFLENDDANRALMGSNMQRQAVPLLQPEAPFVGTGMEDGGRPGLRRRRRRQRVGHGRSGGRLADRDPGHRRRRARRFGGRHLQSAEVPALQPEHLHQPAPAGEGRRPGAEAATSSPTVRRTDLGELALGRNVLVAFMPWNGYNFEDSILISERIVRDDVFTSIHIEEFEVMARDTKLGPESDHPRHPERRRGERCATSTRPASSTSAPR